MVILTFIRHALALKRLSRATRQEVQALQQRRFRRLVEFVAQKSPYYQDIIRTHKIDIATCTPQDFPVLTKSDVIEQFDRIVTDPAITKAKVAAFFARSHDPGKRFLDKYYAVHTSGSSGTIGYYVYREDEMVEGLAPISLAKDREFGQRVAYVAAAKGHFAGATMASMADRLPLLYRNMEKFDINHDRLETISRKLNAMQPTNLSGYAFSLKKLAEAQDAGQLRIQPRLVQSGGEPLTPQDKIYIERVFGVPVVNVYAAAEHMIMGIGRDDFGGMYLMEHNLIFEIQPKCLLVTNLYNYTLPLIRYQMSDQLHRVKDTVNRLPMTKVTNIVGRDEYVPYFTNKHGQEEFLHPSLFSAFDVPQVNRFQMVVKGKKSFVFKINLLDGLSGAEIKDAIEATRGYLSNILAKKDMHNVRFKVEATDRLPVDRKTGKFQFVVKEGKATL